MSVGHYQAFTKFLHGTELGVPDIQFQIENDGEELQDVLITVLHTKHLDNWTYADLAFYRKWILTIPVQMDKVRKWHFTGMLQEMTGEVADKVQARLLSDPTLNDKDLHFYP